MQKDNLCYSLLPKPTNPAAGRRGLTYEHYPYAGRAQQNDDQGFNDYALRTNTRFTDMWTHLNSVRIAELLMKSAEYEKIKYHLVLESVGCLNQADRDEIARLVPGMKLDEATKGPRANFAYVDPRTNPILYEQNTFQFLTMKDVWSGVIKSAVFGLILTHTGCVRGYYTSGGAEGVGKATTNAVVSASLIILLSDFFLTKILF
jgi:hypothetical protein